MEIKPTPAKELQIGDVVADINPINPHLKVEWFTVEKITSSGIYLRSHNPETTVYDIGLEGLIGFYRSDIIWYVSQPLPF